MLLGQGDRCYIDESSTFRSTHSLEYLICAAIVPTVEEDLARTVLNALRLNSQKKLHWHQESPKRKLKIIETISQLNAVSLVVTHSERATKSNERFRRKCLELTYLQLMTLGVSAGVVESRTPHQDFLDEQHVLALRNKKVIDAQFRIDHVRGAHEPLLWIPDFVLGAVNEKRNGDSRYYELISNRIIFEEMTDDSA